MTSRSATLLGELLARAELETARLARALDCEEHELAAFARAEAVMKLRTQERLADFIIEEVPAMARKGHALKAQVAAATSFQQRETTTHLARPGSWPKRSR